MSFASAIVAFIIHSLLLSQMSASLTNNFFIFDFRERNKRTVVVIFLNFYTLLQQIKRECKVNH